MRAAVTGLGLERAHLASQPGRPVEDLQNLVAGRPDLARQRVAAPGYGLDALQDSGRCVARPGRLEPRGRLRVVTSKLVQVGVQGLRPRHERLGRGGQAPIGPLSRSRQIEQVVELQHVDGGVGEDTICLWEIPLDGLYLDCQRVDLRAGRQPPSDPLLAYLEGLRRGENLRHGGGCAGLGGRLRRFGAPSRARRGGRIIRGEGHDGRDGEREPYKPSVESDTARRPDGAILTGTGPECRNPCRGRLAYHFRPMWERRMRCVLGSTSPGWAPFAGTPRDQRLSDTHWTLSVKPLPPWCP